MLANGGDPDKLQNYCCKFISKYLLTVKITYCLSLVTCGANMKYNPARTMTMPSCDDPRPARPAPGPVSEGCECLPKFLYDPGRKECVQKRECGCMSANEYISVRNFDYHFQPTQLFNPVPKQRHLHVATQQLLGRCKCFTFEPLANKDEWSNILSYKQLQYGHM